jgi:transposase
VVLGKLDHRSNAFVIAINCPMQQAKRSAKGFRTAANLVAIVCQRSGKLGSVESRLHGRDCKIPTAPAG